MNRREFLRLASLGGLGALMLPQVGCGGGSSGGSASNSTFFKKPPNILILMTDEQRAAQHWPKGWADTNLPSLDRLRAHGLNFTSSFTNTCQCSPSRATLLTSTYAPVNKVTITDGTLNPSLPNLAKIFQSAGYNVAYKGKWHLTVSFIPPFAITPQDTPQILANNSGLAESYGFPSWNSPDAGDSLSQIASLGAGAGGNDARYVSGVSPGAPPTNILDFIAQYDSDKPFCLIASLVNPHDVFVYPKRIESSGYTVSAFNSLPIELPPTYTENLSTKPTIQGSFLNALNQVWPFANGTTPVEYVQFYAYLNTLADAQLMSILDALDAKKLTESTVIVRIADHGELGLSHGGLRQKDYTAYEEMIRIPMIISNPRLFPKPLETDSLAGLIDVLPTLMTLAGIKKEIPQFNLQGLDLTPLFDRPASRLQDRILFIYDDMLLIGDLQGAAHIRCIRESQWKYAMYFDPAGAFPTEFEMYDLVNDPLETTNLAFGETPDKYKAERDRLQAELDTIMQETGTTPASA